MTRYHAERIDGRPFIWVLTPITKPPLSEVTEVLRDIRMLSEGDPGAKARKDEIVAAKTDLVQRLEHAEATVEGRSLLFPDGADWTGGRPCHSQPRSSITNCPAPSHPRRPHPGRHPRPSPEGRLAGVRRRHPSRPASAALTPPPSTRPTRQMTRTAALRRFTQ